MFKKKEKGQVMIECPNTVFHLFVRNEEEVSKIEIFMNNIRSAKSLTLTDIYNWCNRQGIDYDARFNYHKELSLWNNTLLFGSYVKQKSRYKWTVQTQA